MDFRGYKTPVKCSQRDKVVLVGQNRKDLDMSCGEKRKLSSSVKPKEKQ